MRKDLFLSILSSVFNACLFFTQKLPRVLASESDSFLMMFFRWLFIVWWLRFHSLAISCVVLPRLIWHIVFNSVVVRWVDKFCFRRVLCCSFRLSLKKRSVLVDKNDFPWAKWSRLVFRTSIFSLSEIKLIWLHENWNNQYKWLNFPNKTVWFLALKSLTNFFRLKWNKISVSIIWIVFWSVEWGGVCQFDLYYSLCALRRRIKPQLLFVLNVEGWSSSWWNGLWF